MKYLGAMMARGHPIQYFIEGGRSRTGRLLDPKTGMLSMTLRSYIRHPVRPVVFVPVYLGYERIMEVDSYVNELSGKPKEKESLLGFLRSLRRLRENFGHVHVNVGEPIPLVPRAGCAPAGLAQQAGAGRAWRHGERRGGRAGATHHAQHQCRGGRDTREPGGAGDAGHAAGR